VDLENFLLGTSSCLRYRREKIASYTKYGCELTNPLSPIEADTGGKKRSGRASNESTQRLKSGIWAFHGSLAWSQALSFHPAREWRALRLSKDEHSVLRVAKRTGDPMRNPASGDGSGLIRVREGPCRPVSKAVRGRQVSIPWQRFSWLRNL